MLLAVELRHGPFQADLVQTILRLVLSLGVHVETARARPRVVWTDLFGAFVANRTLRRYPRYTDEAARERKKLDSEVVETADMKAKRLEKAVRQETIKEQVQVRDQNTRIDAPMSPFPCRGRQQRLLRHSMEETWPTCMRADLLRDGVLRLRQRDRQF